MQIPFHLLSENFIKTKKITEDTTFQIEEIDPRELLCPERLDLAAKIAYIEAREAGGNMTFAKELYAKHIEAFSEGNFIEPGDDKKDSLNVFFEVFNELIEDFKKHGFDEKKSLVPVGSNNIILDGAHRTACAIYFGKKIKVIRFPHIKVDFGYSYFSQRYLNEELIKYMAVVYSRYAIKKLYFACVWPLAMKEKRSIAVDVIKEKHRVIVDSDVMLSRNGLRNLMLQIYQHQDWIGQVDNHFVGVMGKVDACFVPGNSTQLIMFEGGELQDVLNMKEEIRNVFMKGKHAIHISDSNEETKLMAELLLNKNSVHALNYGQPDAFPQIYKSIKASKKEKFMDIGATLGFYGISENNNLFCEKNIIDDYNPRTYFVFEGLKLPALSIVKEKLKTKKSFELKKVNKLLQKNNPNNILKRRTEYAKIKAIWLGKKSILRIKQVLAKVSTKIGLYGILHKIHNKLRGINE